MARLTEADIEEIKRVYAEVGSYAETARRTGRSPATIKRYVAGEPTPAKRTKQKDPDLIDFESINVPLEAIEPKPIDEIIIPTDGFRTWTMLNQAEREALNLGTVRKKK